MSKHTTVRTLAMGLVIASGAAHAGLFSKKAKPAPPPPPEPVVYVAPLPPPPPPAPIPLEFSGIQTAPPQPAPMDRLQSASKEVLDTVQWVGASKDNAGLPFVVVDKVNARAYAFTPHAQLKATAPVLLGGGIGDKVLVSPDAPMSAIPVQKRITPAGRYVSKLVIDNHGDVVLLVDGPNLITIHKVVKGTPVQRRAERLTSPTSADNRVSYGCINVPPGFFTTVVDPDFRPAKGLVYILPETQTPGQLFGFQPAPVVAPVTAVAAALAPSTTTGIQYSLQAPGTAAAVTAPVTTAVTAPVTAQPVGAATMNLSLQVPQASAPLAPAPAATFAPSPTFVPAATTVPAATAAPAATTTPPAAPVQGAAAGDTTVAK